MSIDEINKIDIISTSQKGDTWLTIADHFDWSDPKQHLLLLQDKINAYIQFIEEGEIFETHPDAKKEQISIQVVFKIDPTVDAISFLEKCKQVITDLGIGFFWQTHNPKT